MFILKFNNCRVFVTPLVAAMEMVIIFHSLHAIPSIYNLGLNFIEYGVISSLILMGTLGSFFMHEYGHSLAARWMRLPVREINLSLLGAFTSVAEPPSPKAAFIISTAGPLVNILIGIILYAAHLAFKGSDIISTVCSCLSVFNVTFAAFNLLPVLPLDGGFIVRSAFWSATSDLTWANEMSFNIATGFILICFLAGIISVFMPHPVVSVIFFIVGLSLWQSERSVHRQMLAASFWNMMNPENL
jgi:Zn-dependent protease